MAKNTIVTLISSIGVRDFEVSHAERLLGMANNGGWKLVKESQYQYDKKNGITIREDKRVAKKPIKKASSK